MMKLILMNCNFNRNIERSLKNRLGMVYIFNEFIFTLKSSKWIQNVSINIKAN